MKRLIVIAIALVAVAIGSASATPTGIVSCPTFDGLLVEHLKLNGILGANASVTSVSFTASELDTCHKLTVTFNVTNDVKKAIHDATAP